MDNVPLLLCENKMRFGNCYQGFFPDVSDKFVNGMDTVENSTCPYMFRSCCCLVIGSIFYTSSIICGVFGIFECVVTSGKSDKCKNTADIFCHNTTQWGTCLYEICCARDNNNDVQPKKNNY